MIKLKSLLNEVEGYVYHVAPKWNYNKIRRYGLLTHKPKIDDPSDEPKAVYLFPSKEEAFDALENWLKERWGTEPLVILTIDPTGLDIQPRSFGDYELISYKDIPPQNIVKVEDI